MEYTYETKNTGKLETYEWDRIWYEHAPDNETKRVLLLGDSISCGYHPYFNTQAAGKVFVDLYGTSKSVDNPFFIPSLELFFAQQGHREYIFVNNGLHGWHLSAEEYKNYYRELLVMLKKHCDKVIINLTTPLYDINDLSVPAKRNEDVKARNKAACELAEELDIPVNDQYSVIFGKTELFSSDGVHLKAEGYAILADKAYKMLDL